VFLPELRRYTKGKVSLAAQDVHPEKSGTYTGSISMAMLKSMEVWHVILGHSERRAVGETDQEVNKKLKAVLKGKCTPIVCIGETKRDHSGSHFNVVESQLKAALEGISAPQIKKMVIAYEPVWAISKGDGRGKTATPEDAHEMKLFIQKFLTHTYNRATANAVPIVYGGSVNAQNAASFVKEGEMQGYLVGGASLKPKEFGEVINAALKA
jgi:triosephosphate isomerase